MIGSMLIGDGGIPWVQNGLTNTIADAVHYKLLSVEKVEDDVKMVYVQRER